MVNQQTRKSTRARSLTAKAKQLQTDSKPVLRSISTIDEDENTYNNLNFKKRKISLDNDHLSLSDDEDEQENVNDNIEEEVEEEMKPNFEYNVNIDNDDEDSESISDEDDEEQILSQLSGINKINDDGYEFSQSDEDDYDSENIFNSDEDNDYYSAISDYENEIKPKFSIEKQESQITQSNFLIDNNLFNNNSNSSNSSSNCFELKSLEENFQKIIKEKNETQNTSSSSLPQSTESLETQQHSQQQQQNEISIEDFVNYTNELTDDNHKQSLISSLNSSFKYLQYRHDERHNLAFPDVSTFPIRYDPLPSFNTKKSHKNSKRIRALNRRAILSGKASEMVGVGISNFGEFTF
ncbi:hypothetical protein WICMUC_004859 [Wickerhamomyces mucosus]|uniref:Uncharacterized protein n=1 Tax=Wickerhamomyces mucosus TaxID=1378264 RepID=A0A9P8PDP8_9ASCO|nr:hypothetical protein WICMUC_004859 [Wickerhamomyces mucosus]